MEKARKAMAFGTFDILHPGHVYYLGQAKRLAQELVVVVARDATVRKLKKKSPANNEGKRVLNLKQLGIADRIIIGNPGDKYRVIEQEKPDLICLGYDQTFFTARISEELGKRGLFPRVVRIPAYKPRLYKSSKISRAHSKNIK